MKKLELREARSFTALVLVASAITKVTILPNGEELHSSTLQYIHGRGDGFVSANVGIDKTNYKANLKPVLMSVRKKEAEIAEFVGKSCIVSGSVGYYADEQTEIYKPVLRVSIIMDTTKMKGRDIKMAVSDETTIENLPAFDDITEALKTLKYEEETASNKKHPEPAKPIWDLLGKTEKEWNELDKATKVGLVDEHIKAKQLRDPLAQKALHDQIA